MNWGSAISAIVGACIGGIFLIAGQYIALRNEAYKIRKIVFVEMFNNMFMLDGYINNILKNGVTPSKYVLPFNLSTSIYDSVEPEYLSHVSFGEYSKLRKNVYKIKELQFRVSVLQKKYAEGGQDNDYYFETKQILVRAQRVLLDSAGSFLTLLSSRDIRDLKLAQHIEKARERLELYNNAHDSPDIELVITVDLPQPNVSTGYGIYVKS